MDAADGFDGVKSGRKSAATRAWEGEGKSYRGEGEWNKKTYVFEA